MRARTVALAIGLGAMTPLGGLVGQGGKTAAAPARPSPLAGLEAVIDSIRQAFSIPGMAVGIVKDDSLVFARGFGVKQLGKPDPVDERTLFAIGSNTKSFTSLAAAMLVDDGKLKWNDRITQWLPGFQLFDPYATRELTVRDVLSHRSGLGRRGDALWYGSGLSREEVIRRIRYLEPNAGFRTEMGYQNIMFLTGGQVVAAASGMSYDDFVKTRIFRPLGMTTSGTSPNELAEQTDVSTPHAIDKDGARVIPWKNIDNVGPAGSINSNVVEMAQYLRLHLGNGTYKGQRLVSAANLGVTKTPHINAGGVGDSVTHFSSYGLGWVLIDYHGKKIAWHNGGIDGMLSEMWTVPEVGLGIVVLTNGAPHPAGPVVVSTILDRYLLGAPSKDYLAEAKKQWAQVRTFQAAQEKQTNDSRVQGTKPSLPLERYAGTYSDPMYGDLVVSYQGGALTAQWLASRMTLEHWHYNTFQAKIDPPPLGGGAPFVTFQIDVMGRVSKAEVAGLATFLAKNPGP
jgi:CubicO group peptidase (beta-lactamase class C family)